MTMPLWRSPSWLAPFFVEILGARARRFNEMPA
jgi:hypothetical protein